jgi:hypothetical protein
MLESSLDHSLSKILPFEHTDKCIEHVLKANCHCLLIFQLALKWYRLGEKESESLYSYSIHIGMNLAQQ